MPGFHLRTFFRNQSSQQPYEVHITIITTLQKKKTRGSERTSYLPEIAQLVTSSSRCSHYGKHCGGSLKE